MVEKKELRKELNQKRQKLTVEVMDKVSIEIKKQLISLDEIKSAKKIGLTLPIKGEVNLEPFIKWCFENDKKVYIPNTENKLMRFGELESDYSGLFKTKFGTLEPVINSEVEPDIDIQIIPGVAFDIGGGRLGFGGGFYDRYLESFRGLKIAVCYDFQLITKVPTEEHDILMDKVITNKRVITVKNNE